MRKWVMKMAAAVWQWQKRVMLWVKGGKKKVFDNCSDYAEVFSYLHNWSKRELVKEVIACKVIIENVKKAYGIQGDIKRFLWSKDKKENKVA